MRGKVKCIYIDPPHNTGNGWCYNDVTPTSRKWLGKWWAKEGDAISNSA